MNKSFQNCLIIITSLLFVVSMQGCVTLGSPSGEVLVRDGDTRVAISFNEHDRELIHRYYKKKQKHMPPGLAKKINYHRVYINRWLEMGISRPAFEAGLFTAILKNS